MKGAAGRRSQSPIDHSSYYTSAVDSQRGTPVGASDDESTSRSINGTPHSIVQISDEPVNIYDNTSIKRTDSLQGNTSYVMKYILHLQSKITGHLVKSRQSKLITPVYTVGLRK